ncbi:hypothetical protein CU669_11110 [Paramagnetospirillum kuznetsovii]|uniref:NAD-dependent epimerase/dehydratase domain-containing protein n=1 Tax=Paramagnetospirillum kuznetsovii TaxID=2053833 RepID=A0A364NY56_9PROT|nr:NAD(P)-dependent oxidoreductase [Paramagnetospirillum kuznetsovii]RAU21847.1 hypothetical protein CU669_11110 [Paramagnetospirillum kuznetsovii]
MTDHIVITGYEGYIGRRLLASALALGLTVTALGRRPPPPATHGLRWFRWDLESPVPVAALAAADGFSPIKALIHAAHQWTSARSEADDENVVGTGLLLDAARRSGIGRIVFCSSVSERMDALNRYGRIKAAIGHLLTADGEISARIGLVYGGPRQGQWGTMVALSGMVRLLPMVGIRTGVQPIHVDEVCDGLLRLALAPRLSRRVYGLAAPTPISFGEWLRLLCRIFHGRRLWVLPLPLSPILALVHMFNQLPLELHVDEERLLGLAGLPTVSCADDLAEIGLRLIAPDNRLWDEGTVRRRNLLQEGRAILRAVCGGIPSPSLLKIYVRGVERYGAGLPLALPIVALRWPLLLRAVEPVRADGELKSRLQMALVITDGGNFDGTSAYAFDGEGRIRALAGLAWVALVETLLLAFRLTFGRKGQS